MSKTLIIVFFMILGVEAYAVHPVTGEPIRTVDIVIGDARAHLQDASQSQFRLNAYVNGIRSENLVGNFLISPGKLSDGDPPGKESELTPEGRFHPTRLVEDYVSKQYGGRILGIFETGSMPNTIFFHRGFAIHGSYGSVNGRPASHGCVRLRPSDSEKLFAWVSEAVASGGLRAVTIHISNTEDTYVARHR